MLSDQSAGRNVEQRCSWLWTQIQDFYRRSGTVDRLYDITVTMIKPKKGSIELGGSGAQIRALIPYGVEPVDSWEDLDEERMAAKLCMHSLATCYNFLSQAARQEEGELLHNALAFQRNLQVLFAMNPKRWQLRHYREDSYGGSVSKQAHRWEAVKVPWQ